LEGATVGRLDGGSAAEGGFHFVVTVRTPAVNEPTPTASTVRAR